MRKPIAFVWEERIHMDMFICLMLFAVGIALVVKGGDAFVDAASWIAKAMDLSLIHI